MIKLFQILLSVLLASLFLFPLELLAFPGWNSKKVMAVFGLAIYLLKRIYNKDFSFDWSFAVLIGFASGVSIMSLLAIVYNQTPDDAYVDYVISFLVWLCAAYVVCDCIKWTHGTINVRLVVSYLAGVCVLQCISALVIDSNPAFQTWVDNTFEIEQKLMHEVRRLYGLSAHLDVAGARFSAVLVSIAFILTDEGKISQWGRSLLFVAFLFISVVGNMIARTTLVGMAIGIVWILYRCVFHSKELDENQRRSSLVIWLSILITGIIVCIILYNTNYSFYNSFRFGFEGFFSFFETGTWTTDSNEKLKTMIVWPETLKTWFIGDGYFENSSADPNYLGHATDQGFYMGTDIGYLRFIFYFGIFGLISIIGVVVQSCYICRSYYPKKRMMFLLILLIGFIVWFKVSTDIFCVFSLFLCASSLKDTEPSEEAVLSEQ